MKKNTMKLRNTRLVRMMKRLLGEEKGAVAMEYIVIALLVAAAVIGLVMVFSGNLRNKLSTANKTMTAKSVDEVEKVAKEYQTENQNLDKANKTAEETGKKIGGETGNSNFQQ